MTQGVKALGKVAVLMGGWSAEREVSLMSGQGVLEALRGEGVDAHSFDPKVHDVSELKRQGFNRCFIALHGAYGEDGAIQGALELLGMPYTGSGVMASAISMDKVMTKRVWLFEGIPTPAYEVVHGGDGDVNAVKLASLVNKLGLPMIVKPAREGSSIGVFKVETIDTLAHAIQEASKLDAQVLCEQFIAGDEVTCAVLGKGQTAVALPVVRITAPQGNYDYEHKYFTNDTQYECPAKLSQEETKQLGELVLKAYKVLDCRGWSRLDVMIDGKTRKPYILEINTSPGMTGHSLVPMAARAAGMSYGQLCVKLLESATLDACVKKD